MMRICTIRIPFSLKVLQIVRVSGPLKDGYVIKITSEDCEYQVQQRTGSKARKKEPACNASSLGDNLRQIIQFKLQRRVLRIVA